MKKQSDSISFLIVTPSFNQADYIEESIKSVLNQTGLRQYVVMDGKSTDKTTNILKKYKAKHFFWVSKPDKGQTDAINQGIKLINQKVPFNQDCVFAYLNSDDVYLKNSFATVAKVFSQNPDTNWVVGDCRIIDRSGKEIHQLFRFYKKILRKFYQPWFLFITNPLPQPATFIRWSAIQQIGQLNPKLKFVMDYEYWLRLQAKFGPPTIIDQALASFRVHPQSKGGSQYKKQFAEALTTLSQFNKNKFMRWLHQCHNQLITVVYSFIK